MSAVKYVRRGAIFADIGTDHAYLPIYLLKAGLIERAVLSDINEGPLASARENALESELLDRVELVLTDGADGLSDRGITDVAIFGMGGELIADIIERAPFASDGGVRFILQPMTKQEHLCKYLEKRGFRVIGESYTADAGRFYRTVCVSLGEGGPMPSNFEKIGLSTTPCEEIEAKIGYLNAHLASVIRAAEGKRTAGLDATEQDRTAEIITSEIERLKARIEL